MKRAVRASGDGAPPPDDPSGAEDVQLMLRAARDDMEAFGLLVEKHQKSLLNFFARCGVERDVEDLAQLTFLKLHRMRRAYRPAAKFTTFLFLIAKQTMLDRVRSDARKAALHERAGREAEPAMPPPAARGERDDARRALSRLSPGLAAAVALVVMQGFEYNEAAEILEIPVGTVKSRVHAALKQMRDYLREPPPSARPGR